MGFSEEPIDKGEKSKVRNTMFEGNQFMVPLIGIVIGLILLLGLQQTSDLPIGIILLIGLTPMAIAIAIVYLFMFRKPPHYASDYFKSFISKSTFKM